MIVADAFPLNEEDILPPAFGRVNAHVRGKAAVRSSDRDYHYEVRTAVI